MTVLKRWVWTLHYQGYHPGQASAERSASGCQALAPCSGSHLCVVIEGSTIEMKYLEQDTT